MFNVYYYVYVLCCGADVGYWIGNIRAHAKDGVVVGLVGNKTDCVEERQVSPEQGRQAALEWGVQHFFECSAKSGHNVKHVFESLTRAAVQEIVSVSLFVSVCSVVDVFIYFCEYVYAL
jgi:GTPase SAR1 family protein